MSIINKTFGADRGKANFCSCKLDRGPTLNSCITTAIILLIGFVLTANAAGSFDSLDLLGTCYKGNTVVPACQTCDYNGGLSCSEGLYLVTDKQVGVENGDLAIIETTDTDQSKYFARRNSRKGYKGGAEGTNGVDELGCTDVFQDQSLTDSTSMLVSVGDGSAKTAKYGSDAISGCQRGNNLGVGTLSSSRLLSMSYAYQFKDSVLQTGNYLAKTEADLLDERNLSTGSVSNCNSGATSASICDKCNTGYFLESSTTGTSGISNGDVGANSASGTQGNSNTFLKQSTGVGVTSGDSSEYVNISNFS